MEKMEGGLGDTRTLYAAFMAVRRHRRRTFRPLQSSDALQIDWSVQNGFRLYRRGPGSVRAIRRLRRPAAAGVIMVVTILYVIGGVGVIAYMLAALLRPEKF
jgi:hypothetical protein